MNADFENRELDSKIEAKLEGWGSRCFSRGGAGIDVALIEFELGGKSDSFELRSAFPFTPDPRAAGIGPDIYG